MKKRVLLITSVVLTVLALSLIAAPFLWEWLDTMENTVDSTQGAEGKGLLLFVLILVFWPIAGAVALFGGLFSVLSLRGRPWGGAKWTSLIALILNASIAIPILLTVLAGILR